MKRLSSVALSTACNTIVTSQEEITWQVGIPPYAEHPEIALPGHDACVSQRLVDALTLASRAEATKYSHDPATGRFLAEVSHRGAEYLVSGREGQSVSIRRLRPATPPDSASLAPVPTDPSHNPDWPATAHLEPEDQETETRLLDLTSTPG